MLRDRGRLIVLGARGMLGSQIMVESRKRGVTAIGSSRQGPLGFDANRGRFADFANVLKLCEDDFLVNCIGWIPQKASENEHLDQLKAHRLNVDLVSEISVASGDSGFRWLQIGTDCVFSGPGPHMESDSKVPTDLYSSSKIRSENFVSNALFVRSSIIGLQQPNPGHGLLDWFKSQPKNAHVQGFSNAFWNGVTTTAFAKLALGLFSTTDMRTLNCHWVPSNFVSKYELLLIARDLMGRSDISIKERSLEFPIDRRLGAEDPAMNDKLWRVAGYLETPTIEALLQEALNREQVAG